MITMDRNFNKEKSIWSKVQGQLLNSVIKRHRGVVSMLDLEQG